MSAKLKSSRGFHYATVNGVTMVFTQLSTALYYIFFTEGLEK